MKAPRARVREFEIAEAEDRITLKSLRRIANALDCQLVYAIVPKSGTVAKLAERMIQTEVRQHVLNVEQNMALENQAPGGVDELIREQMNRRLKR